MLRRDEDESPPGPDLDRIRSDLRTLGYLRGPLSSLEGWMMAGRGGPSSFLRLNAAASLRVAAVGGPTLGIPAAVAVALANRPHIITPRDLILLALYFSLALGAALGLMEFLTDLALLWLARRGYVLVGRIEQIAARAGLFATAATTLYLAWLLRGGRRPSSEGIGAWLAWSGALIVTLAVGHFIGRLTRAGSLLALAAAGGFGAEGPPAASGRRRAIVLAGLALLALASGLLVFAPADFFSPSASAASRFEPRPFAGRIVFVGIDGLSAELFDRMRALGLCPVLEGIERRGARYALHSEGPRVPPVTWTTIATGRPREQHGILGYQSDRVPGLSTPVQEDPASRFVPSIRMLLPPLRRPPSPVSSGLRRALAVWEILSRRGIETAVVNWWATWPASPGDGIVVSERAFVRFTAGLKPDRDVAPESLQTALADRFDEDLAGARVAAAGGVPAGEQAGGVASTSITLDAYHSLVAQRLFEGGLARVLLVYLPGLDIARTRAGQTGREEQEKVLARVVRGVDALTGAFLSLLKPEDLLLIVGDPGRQAGEGFFLATGTRVVPGRRVREVSFLDMAPTLLSLAGFPVARDLPGIPVVEFLRAGDPSARLAVPIDTYGAREEPFADLMTDPFDKEVLDRLRSLGYIQ